ncbi:MAG TPA: hypothetical protein DCP06_06205 [Lachnospiraceae bacterium]|nr:hypothetical protein [Lachnospiraceae bacterium]
MKPYTRFAADKGGYMSLKLITGVSGSGKTTRAFDICLERAKADPGSQVIVIVPDQFSQEAAGLFLKKCECILNIDVLSFRRLAYRALEEYAGEKRVILSDEGKIMLLRKVLSENKNKLEYFKKGLDRPGFLDECKSLLSEFMEYDVGDDEISVLIDEFGAESRSAAKLRDLKLIYDEMEARLGETYRFAEELIPSLTDKVDRLSFLKNATVCLDDFTGFSPVQYELIGRLMKHCRDVIVTVTYDNTGSRDELFSLSVNTIKKLIHIAGEQGVGVDEITVVGSGEDKGSYRLKSDSLSFLEKHLFAYDNKRYTGEIGDIAIRECKNERAEARFAAWESARYIRAGVDPSSIAVICGDLERYAPHLKRYFDEAGVPYFIDKKMNIGTNPLSEFIMSFFDMMEHGFDIQSIMRFSKCALSPFYAECEDGDEACDRLENYMLASGRHGFAAFAEEWRYDVGGSYTPERLERINVSRELIFNSLRSVYEGLKGGKKTVKEFSVIICNFIINNNCYERLKNMAAIRGEEDDILMQREYERIYPAVMAVFDMLVDIMGDESMTLREYIEVVRAGISESVLGFVPPADSQVLIGDIKRSRMGEVSHVIFLGNTDDTFPGGADKPGILSDMERERIEEVGAGRGIELAPSFEESFKQEMLNLYRLVTRPSDSLILTTRISGTDGAEVRPSYLITALQAMFDIDMISDEDDRSPEAVISTDLGRSYLIRHTSADRAPGVFDDICKEIYSYHQRNSSAWLHFFDRPAKLNRSYAALTPSVAGALYGEAPVTSVTRFEKYAACPYQHFLSYGLHVRERDEYSIDARDRGNVYHETLNMLYNEMKACGDTWRTIDEDRLISLGGECFDKVSESYRGDIFNIDKRTDYAMKRMKKVFINRLGYMGRQMKRGEFEQVLSEAAFPQDIQSPVVEKELDNGRRLRLVGRIDRIDICEDETNRYIKLIDYKSSLRDLVPWRVYHGLELQLFTYLNVAMGYKNQRELQNVPAGILFQGIDQRQEKWEPSYEENERLYSEVEEKNARPKGYVDQALISVFDNTLEEGKTSMAIPVRINKSDGNPDRHSKVLEREVFEDLMRFTDETITGMANEMYAGRICASSYKYKNIENGCTYCPYSGVCGLEPRSESEMMREIMDVKGFDFAKNDNDGEKE